MLPVLVGIDRDGTIIKDEGYLGKDDDWEKSIHIYRSAVEGIRMLSSRREIKLVVITNQAGVARGYFDEDRVREVNVYIDEALRAQGAHIDAWVSCPYVDEAYARKHQLPLPNGYVLSDGDARLEMRKPGVGMLREASRMLGHRLEDFVQVYTIGDKPDDALMGVRAGGVGIEIDPKQEHDAIEFQPLPCGKRIKVCDLFEAAEWILMSLPNQE